MAGAISEIALKVMVQDFRRIDPRDARTILVEAGPRILPSFPDALSAKAELALSRIGVSVRKNVAVTSIEKGKVVVAGETIHAETVIWAAGVSASPLAKTLGAPLDRAGRVFGGTSSHCAGLSRNFRDRRLGGVSASRRRQAIAGSCTRRDSTGDATSLQTFLRICRRRNASTVSIQRSRQHGHDWPWRGCRNIW